MSFKIGDSVTVKAGIKAPDAENIEIGGWQGRVIEIDTESFESTLVNIEWDSLTIDQMPSKFIEQSEIDGLEWREMNLYESELTKSVTRDKKANVKEAQERQLEKLYRASLDEEGQRISKVLAGTNRKDEMACLQKWVNHLDKELIFPIQAIVTETENSRIIDYEDEVQIKSLPHIVDMYGIIATIKHEGKKLEFPLCDLEVIDKKSKGYQLINDYCTWFGNR